MKGRPVSQARCNISRECSTTACFFKMLQMGYKVNPSCEMEKRRNAEIERMNGKGFIPEWKVVGNGEFADLYCEEFREKK